MSSIYDWSLLAASNANSDDNINWQEGQPPSSVNNSARSMMQRVRELISDLGAITATTGTANIITFTAKSPFSSYVDGVRIAFRATNSNTGSATFNVNSVGAKPVFTVSASTGVSALIAGNIVANGIYEVIYSAALDSGSGGWLLLNPTLQIKPVGALEIMAAPSAPTGFLYCNGQAVSRTTYAALYNYLGTRWGTGNGSTTFNIPDFRGAFLRGWDDGAGLDSGRVFATYQDSDNKKHAHTGTTNTAGEHVHTVVGAFGQFSGPAGATSGNSNLSNPTTPAGNHSHLLNINETGGSESRPKNHTVYFCIKY